MITEAKKRHTTSGLPIQFVEGDAQHSVSRGRLRPLPGLSARSCISTIPSERLPRWCGWCAQGAGSWCSTSTGIRCSSTVRKGNNAQDRPRLQRCDQARLDRAQPAPPVPRRRVDLCRLRATRRAHLWRVRASPLPRPPGQSAASRGADGRRTGRAGGITWSRRKPPASFSSASSGLW